MGRAAAGARRSAPGEGDTGPRCCRRAVCGAHRSRRAARPAHRGGLAPSLLCGVGEWRSATWQQREFDEAAWTGTYRFSTPGQVKKQLQPAGERGGVQVGGIRCRSRSCGGRRGAAAIPAGAAVSRGDAGGGSLAACGGGARPGGRPGMPSGRLIMADPAGLEPGWSGSRPRSPWWLPGGLAVIGLERIRRPTGSGRQPVLQEPVGPGRWRRGRARTTNAWRRACFGLGRCGWRHSWTPPCSLRWSGSSPMLAGGVVERHGAGLRGQQPAG